MRLVIIQLVTALVCLLLLRESCAWRGWCSRSCYRWNTKKQDGTRCLYGWTHTGDQNCIIPICSPSCANGGICTRPNTCDCPSWSQGPGCRQLTCSYKRPCYPGECQSDQSCICENGFKSAGSSQGCTIIDDRSLAPTITKSTITLANVRRTDNKTSFMFMLDGTQKNETDILWSNQKRFNNLQFELEAIFNHPENFPARPFYVHDDGLGVAEGYIEANVSSYPKDGGLIRDSGFLKKYNCDGAFSKDNPAKAVAYCSILDDQFKTLIEHGDWLNIKFYTKSGGYQSLLNLDQNRRLPTRYYQGLLTTTQVEFRFDFVAPKHCSQNDSLVVCPRGEHILKVDKEFTKDPIRITWLGWTDSMSGLDRYYVEVFKLSPSLRQVRALIELTPLDPIFSQTIQHSVNITFPVYTPTEPGMYSVLMQTSDKANNSRIARRLVLFDNKSVITVNNATSARLYVSSAVPETGYKWQTTKTSGQNVTFVVNWTDHFINYIHKNGHLLDRVASYPIQFEQLEDDNILFSKKFVSKSMDDYEGKRTINAIPNFNGIVSFDVNTADISRNITRPGSGWQRLQPISETTTFSRPLADGDGVQISIRATDVMGNVVEDVTNVWVDSTPPRISNIGEKGTELKLNVNGTFNYTSRITFSAKDQDSGVFQLGYTIILRLPHKNMEVKNKTAANIGKASSFDCTSVNGICYLSQQTLDLDNCMFMVNKDDLDTANASIVVSAYNQAMLSSNLSFEVGPISKLKGLEKYSGPTNMRIENLTPHGFRVAWNLPEKTSCYGLADIVIILFKKGSNGSIHLDTFYASGAKTYYDILGLTSLTEYSMSFGIKSSFAPVQKLPELALAVKLPAPETGSGVGTSTIIGVSVGLISLVAIVIAVFVVLVRRGVIHPQERARTIKRAVTRKYRETMYGDAAFGGSSKSAAYDNRTSDLYIYGGMDFKDPQIWEINRQDVGLEALIKTGSFANIYKASIRQDRRTETVVAKTLKVTSWLPEITLSVMGKHRTKNYTPEDELLMKAKINFSGTVIGNHTNVLKFIGAVMDDENMGPFMLYEYCEKGSLRDYMVVQRSNVTLELQEHMYRFGVQIVRGMEYLASKGDWTRMERDDQNSRIRVVHRRLAARNILLTFLNEVKIAGFGPQPNNDPAADEDGNKKERIPLKWMAPECMTSTLDATELSDVWSCGVVLWEIFALGETPYNSVRSRDLPSKIKKGTRLSKPENCDDTWYNLMNRCWSYEASKRPPFSEIRGELDNLFVAAPGDDYYYSAQ